VRADGAGEPVPEGGIGRAGGVHADQDRGIVAIAFVEGGRDAGANRLEGAGAAAVQRCRHVEFLTDLHLAAPACGDVPDGPADETCEARGVGYRALVAGHQIDHAALPCVQPGPARDVHGCAARAETLAEVAVGAHVELPGRSLQLAQGVEGLGGVLGRAVQGLQADEVGGGDAGPDTKDHGHSSH
jgi:hypothetical protein